MKLQSLAIIFVIIVLPISLVLSAYIDTRIETLSLQSSFDSKLNDATYDALKAYQLNSLSSDTSDYSNSKIRDINASVNTFFNTMSSSFATLGFSKKTLQNYVPALVYTMYDGYYIYSPYTNTWDAQAETANNTSYSNGEDIYGLKPYVYYSCRYRSAAFDVTITYSLDNYIQIQGYVTEAGKKKTISKYGYVLDDVEVNNTTGVVKYKGIEIKTETALKEKIYYTDTNGNFTGGEYYYIKRNGTKYYTDGTRVFSVLNGNQIIQPVRSITVSEVMNNSNAKEYYKEAYELKQFIIDKLGDLNTAQIVASTGESYYDISGNIFDWGNIESESSNFNTHRIEVIKNSIERNLAIVINNFNNYSGASTNFQMPKLLDEDWDKIMNNISIISFLQGINIGGKIYNGYSIITNTKNEDIVMLDSIYILTKNDKVFHRITEENLATTGIVGIYNVNLERRSIENNRGGIIYYYPAFPDGATLSYDSIVTQSKIAKDSDQTLIDYIHNHSDENLKEIYYTALARERHGLYRQKLEI